MCYENQGSEEGVDDAEDVAFELCRAGQHDAEGERDEGKVGSYWIADVEEDAVGQDCKERGKAFDCMDKGDGDLRSCGGRKEMSSYLEGGEGECGHDYVSCGITYVVSQGVNMSWEDWEEAC